MAAVCCARSGALAHQQAICRGFPLPQNLQVIQVPCGGHVSSNQLLKLFSMGADGVLVFVCHEGNCYSEEGNRLAKKRIEKTRSILTQVGLDPQRIRLSAMAANMGFAFSKTVHAFKKELHELESNKNNPDT